MWFFVDFGRNGTNEWEPIHPYPIVDGCMALDTIERRFSTAIDHSYRVRLILPEVLDENGLCTHCVSEPCPAGRVLSKKDWLLARAITRREYLRFLRKTNVSDRGFILMRRRWGRRCPRCLDYNDGAVRDGGCPVCFGTGFDKGFYPAIEYVIDIEAGWQKPYTQQDANAYTQNKESIGPTAPVEKRGRALAYPPVQAQDVFVKASGDRYIVDNVAVGAEVGGWPIINIIALKLAPATDIIYSIPLIQEPADIIDETSDVKPNTCTINRGLDNSIGNW